MLLDTFYKCLNSGHSGQIQYLPRKEAQKTANECLLDSGFIYFLFLGLLGGIFFLSYRKYALSFTP